MTCREPVEASFAEWLKSVLFLQQLHSASGTLPHEQNRRSEGLLHSGVTDAGTYQAVHNDCPLLPQAVTPVLRLAVNLRVEIHIMQDDCVGSNQIQALAPGARAQQKGKDAG